MAGRKTGNLPSFSSHQCITTFDRCDSLDQRGRDGKGKDCLTSRNSLSSWGGYRGGCGPGARDGEDLLRRTPNLPRERVLLLRDVETGGARDNTKAMDGSVGSGERIFTFFFLFRGIYKTAGGRTQRGAVRGWERRRAMRATTTLLLLSSGPLYVLRTTLLQLAVYDAAEAVRLSLTHIRLTLH